jgi:Asp-tRNA(Asn)/Glu-tRNA(Gln) amidotransferase A subunit family amidase
MNRQSTCGLPAPLSYLALTVMLAVAGCSSPSAENQTSAAVGEPFDVVEATIEEIHAAYKAKRLTSRQLVQQYLDRIEAYDKKGPNLHSIITVNPKVLEDADALDAAFSKSGLVGPLHGIPVAIKDQVDVTGMPMTLGSVLLKDFFPKRDAFVVEKLRKAGAIILAKATKPELIGGDTYGSMFGATRNPYAPDRTPGGSSGGPAASVAANLATIAIGQEGSASIRRPSAWTALVGMRPTAGLVSRTGVWNGWPTINGSLGPMTRTVADLARLMDFMVGYDPEDPLTAYAVENTPGSYTEFLDANGLKGARLGILREPIGQGSEPDSEDFAKVAAAFDKAVRELKAAGAQVVDPLQIPDLKKLLAQRGGGRVGGPGDDFDVYVRRNPNFPFKSPEDIVRSPGFSQVWGGAQKRLKAGAPGGLTTTAEAGDTGGRDPKQELMINVLKVMADHDLDAIVYNSVEHQPTLVSEGMNPPYVSAKGAPQFNTFLAFVPAISVPAGFTSDNLPMGITFQGRPFSDALMIKLAYAYEQATHHRRPPSSTPALRSAPRGPS